MKIYNQQSSASIGSDMLGRPKLTSTILTAVPQNQTMLEDQFAGRVSSRVTSKISNANAKLSTSGFLFTRTFTRSTRRVDHIGVWNTVSSLHLDENSQTSFSGKHFEWIKRDRRRKDFIQERTYIDYKESMHYLKGSIIDLPWLENRKSITFIKPETSNLDHTNSFSYDWYEDLPDEKGYNPVIRGRVYTIKNSSAISEFVRSFSNESWYPKNVPKDCRKILSLRDSKGMNKLVNFLVRKISDSTALDIQSSRFNFDNIKNSPFKSALFEAFLAGPSIVNKILSIRHIKAVKRIEAQVEKLESEKIVYQGFIESAKELFTSLYKTKAPEETYFESLEEVNIPPQELMNLVIDHKGDKWITNITEEEKNKLTGISYAHRRSVSNVTPEAFAETLTRDHPSHMALRAPEVLERGTIARNFIPDARMKSFSRDFLLGYGPHTIADRELLLRLMFRPYTAERLREINLFMPPMSVKRLANQLVDCENLHSCTFYYIYFDKPLSPFWRQKASKDLIDRGHNMPLDPPKYVGEIVKMGTVPSTGAVHLKEFAKLLSKYWPSMDYDTAEDIYLMILSWVTTDITVKKALFFRSVAKAIIKNLALFGITLKDGVIALAGMFLEFYYGEFNRDAKGNIVYQGFHDSYKAIKESTLIKKLLATITHVVATLVFGEDKAFGTTFIKRMWDSIASMSGSLDLFESVSDFITTFATNYEAYKETGNIWDLLGKGEDTKAFTELNDLILEISSIKTNPLADAREILDRVNKALDKHLKNKNPNIIGLHKKLHSLKLTHIRGIFSDRVEPVAYIITGPPGCGKSKLVSEIETGMKHYLGIDQNISITHSVTETDHQMLGTYVHIVLLNDTFQTKDDKCKLNLMSMLQTLVDSVPVMFEGASIEAKESSYFAPRMVILTTNESKYQFSTSTNTARKLDRRYKPIHCSFTPKCIKEAAKAKLTEAELIKKLYAEGKTAAGYVHYTMGNMENLPDTNVIDFTIKRNAVEFDDPLDLIRAILTEEKNRKRPVSQSFKFCPKCMLPFKDKCCEEPKAQTEEPKAEVQDEEMPLLEDDSSDDGVEVEDVPYSRTPLIEECVRFDQVYTEVEKDVFGSEDKVTFQCWGKRWSIKVDHTVNLGSGTSTTGVVESLSKISNGVTLGMEFTLPTWAKCLIALGAASGTILLCLKAVKVISPTMQGIMSSTPSIPETFSEVEKYSDTSNAWLGVANNHTVELYIGDTFMMRGTLIHNRIITVPAHMFGPSGSFKWGLGEGKVMTVVYGTVKYLVPLQEKYWVNDGKEMSFYYCPNLPSVKGTAFSLLSRNRLIPTCNVFVKSYDYHKSSCSGTGDNLHYGSLTKAGDCGLPVYGVDGCIYAIHFGLIEARSEGVGYKISQSDVLKAMEVYNSRGIHVEVMSDKISSQGTEEGSHPLSDCGWYMKTTSDVTATDHIPLGHNRFKDNQKMSCKKTEIYDLVRPLLTEEYSAPWTDKAPCIDGVYTSVFSGRMEANSTTAMIDAELMDKALDMYLDELPAGKAEPLTDYEAWAGNPQNVLIRGQDVDKSIGPTLKSKGFTKKDIYKPTSTPGRYVIHEEALKMYRSALEEAYGNEPLNPVMIEATVKDEIIPKAKADKGKSRLFYVADVADNKALRKLLLPLLTYLMARPRESSCVVTLNACSPQWEEIVRQVLFLNKDDDPNWTEKIRLDKLNDEYKFLLDDGDQTSYDLRHGVMLDVYIQFMSRLAKKLGYSDTDARALRRLLLRRNRYIVKIEGNYYLVSHGLCSGQPDTSICNCVILKLVCYYSYLRWAKQRSLVVHPRSVIRVACTGDDLLHKNLDRRYSGKDLQDGFSSLGYIMTDGSKNKEMTERTIFEVPYLKRTTTIIKPDGSIGTSDDFSKGLASGRGALKLDSIFKPLCYQLGNSEPNRLYNVAICASREMFLHGRVMYEKYLSLFEGIANCKLHSYDELDELYVKGLFDTWTPLSSTKGKIPLNNIGGEIILQSHTSRVYREEHQYFEHLTNYNIEKKRIIDEQFNKWVVPLGKYNEGENYPESQTFTNNYNNKVDLTTTHETSTNATSVGLNSIDVTAPGIVDNSNITNITTMEEESISLVSPLTAIPRDSVEGADLSKIFSRPHMIITHNLQNDFSGVYLWEEYITAPALTNIVGGYSLYRGSPTVTISYTGGAQYLGKYRFYFYPAQFVGEQNDRYSTLRRADTWTSPFYTTTSQLPHIDIDISEIGTKTITLPFPCSTTFREMGEFDWVMRGHVINTPRMASGATMIPVMANIFLSYDVELHVITPQGASEIPTGPLSLAVSYTSMLASKAKGYLSVYQKIAQSASGMLSKLGWARPSTEPQDAMVMRTSSSLVASGAPSFSYSLGLDVATSKNINISYPLETKGETTIDFYTGSSDLLLTNWVSGVVLNSDPSALNYNISEPTISKYYPTRLSHITSVFDRWTGSLDYCLEVISSPLIRWRMGIVIVPPYAAIPFTFPTDGEYLTYVVECVGSTCFDFTVPYLYENNFREVNAIQTEMASDRLFPTLWNSILPSSLSTTRILYFSLMIPTGPAETAVYPAVNLWIKGGSSYELGIPRLRIRDCSPYAVTYQSSKSSILAFGENVEDVKTLCKRPTIRTAIPASVTSDHFCWPLHNNGFHTMDIGPYSAPLYHTFESYLSPPYIGMNGGHEVKLYSYQNDTSWMLSTSYTNPLAYTGNLLTSGSGSRGAMVFDSRNASMAEVSVPDRNDFSYRVTLMNDLPDWTLYQVECLIAENYKGAQGVGSTLVITSSKDDLTLGGFLCIPPLEQANP